MPANNSNNPILIDFWETLPDAQLDIESMSLSHPEPGVMEKV